MTCNSEKIIKTEIDEHGNCIDTIETYSIVWSKPYIIKRYRNNVKEEGKNEQL